MVKDNTMDKQKKKIILSNFYTQRILDGIGKGDLDSIKQLALHKPDMLPTDIRRVAEKFHSLPSPSDESKKELSKEDGGGGGGFGGDASAGTVFTSSDTGVFTPTYGRNSKRKSSKSSANYRTQVARNKKKFKKRTGVERLAAWMEDFSPQKKSLSKSAPFDFALQLLQEVSKEYRMQDPNLRNKIDAKYPSNESRPGGYRPKIIDWKKKDEDNAGALTYAKALDTESSGEEGRITKEQAGFREATDFEKSQDVQCGSCVFYSAEENHCHVVTGNIEEDAWCSLYDPENPPKPEENQVVEGEDIKKARDLEDYFSNKYPMQSDKLKRRIIRESVFPRECAACKCSEWKGSVVPLELNHINGDHGDNAKSNLELLCPNCHALTPHYRVKKEGVKSAIDLHGGAPKGDPRRDIALDKQLRDVPTLEKAVNTMTEEEREVGATQQVEHDPKFVETEAKLDETAVVEQQEFMDNLEATNSKTVGGKSDDSDIKAQAMAADATFGAEIRLSESFPEDSVERQLMKENPAFDSIVRSLFSSDDK
jgi:hypothetical protein